MLPHIQRFSRRRVPVEGDGLVMLPHPDRFSCHRVPAEGDGVTDPLRLALDEFTQQAVVEITVVENFAVIVLLLPA